MLWVCLVSGSVNSEQTNSQRFAELPRICSPSVFAESFCTGLSFFPCHLQTWDNMLAVPCYLATGCVACLTSVLTGEPGSEGMDVPSPWHPPLRKLFHRYSGVTLNLIRIIYWIRYRCEVFSLASVYGQLEIVVCFQCLQKPVFVIILPEVNQPQVDLKPRVVWGLFIMTMEKSSGGTTHSWVFPGWWRQRRCRGLLPSLCPWVTSVAQGEKGNPLRFAWGSLDFK